MIRRHLPLRLSAHIVPEVAIGDVGMLAVIEEWISQTLTCHADRRVSCARFAADFDGYFSRDFLAGSYYVVCESLPKPNLPGLNELGLGPFLIMDADGITYMNTYFIKPAMEEKLDLHFHELVHVAQWQHLGAKGFIERYIRELLKHSYEHAPLEKMAYSLQRYFRAGHGKPVNVQEHVRTRL